MDTKDKGTGMMILAFCELGFGFSVSQSVLNKVN